MAVGDYGEMMRCQQSYRSPSSEMESCRLPATSTFTPSFVCPPSEDHFCIPIVHVHLHHAMPKEDSPAPRRNRGGNRNQPIVSCLECRRMKWR